MALTDQLLNHFKEKFGIVTVVNATFYDVDGKKPLISFDTLKMSNITSEGQQKEIRGGQGAELLLQYDFGRTANIEITDALVSMGSLEYLFGGQLKTGTFKALRREEGSFIAGAGGAAKLPADLLEKMADNIVIIGTNSEGVKTRFPGTTGVVYDTETEVGNVTFTGMVPGDKFIAFYRSVNFTNGTDGAQEMILRATDFPPTVRMVGETVVLDADKGQKIAVQVEIPKLKLNANFTLNFDAEGDPSVFDFSGVALSHNGELIKVRTLGAY